MLSTVSPRRYWYGRIASAFVLIGALVTLPAAAHDFWIEPAKFRVRAGDAVPLRLLVGQELKGNAALYNPEQFERYLYAGPQGIRPVEGALGDEPAGTVKTTEAGLYVAGYYSKKFEVTFESPEEFDKYLAMEGLERNRNAHRRRASLRRSILEIYTRCAKTVILAGAAPQSPVDRVLGFPLELVAQTNPHRDTSAVDIQLLYEGKPLADALVVASNKQAPTEKIRVRTDSNGRVTLALNRRGMWLITSVHMIPTSLFARADWESFWASLTFERP